MLQIINNIYALQYLQNKATSILLIFRSNLHFFKFVLLRF